jgi:hypothetical protein
MGKWKRSLLLVGADPLHSVRLEHSDHWSAFSTDRSEVTTNRSVDKSVAEEIIRRVTGDSASNAASAG